MKSETIHQFWEGGPIPPKYLEYQQAWLDLNPGWDLKIWNTDSFGPGDTWEVVSDLYQRDNGRNGVELFVQLADIISYEILLRHGGVYVNVDIEPVRSLRHLAETYEIEGRSWAPREDAQKLVNCAMGAPEAGHEFWQACMLHAEELYWANPGAPMTDTTGPKALTETVFQGGHEFCVLPRESFNPTHWFQVQPGGDATGLYDWEADSKVIGVHHWGHKLTGRTNVVESATKVWLPE